jgi:hypothetical protein
MVRNPAFWFAASIFFFVVVYPKWEEIRNASARLLGRKLRLTLYVSVDTMDILEELRKKHQVIFGGRRNIGDVLNSATGDEWILIEEYLAGSRFLVQKADGSLETLDFGFPVFQPKAAKNE